MIARTHRGVVVVNQGSVTTWLHLLAGGDAAAASPLWDRYFPRMVAFAQDRLRRLTVRVADEEDVALSAFHQFCQAAAGGRFARLTNRDDLWQVLLVLTARKALDHHKYQARLKRGRTVDGVSMEEIPSPDDPALKALFADQLLALFESLPDDDVREIAQLKMEGFSNEEVADRLGCTVRTVARRLVLIRSVWEREVAEASASVCP